MPTRPQCRRAEPNGSHRSFSSISSESQRHRLRRPGWVVKKRPNASEDRRACGRGPCGGPRGSAPCPPAEEPREGNGGRGAATGRSRLAREGAAGRLASPAATSAHRAGRPRRDLPLSREASPGSLPLPARRGPLVASTPPTGACGPPPGPRADEQAAERAGGRARAPEPDVSGVPSARALDTPPRWPRPPTSRHP